MNKTSPLRLLETVRFFLYLSPFVFSLYLVKFQIGGIPITFLEAFIYFVFAVWIVEIVRDRGSINWNRRTRRFLLSAFLLLIGATIGVLVAPHSILLPSGELLDAQRVALGVWKGWIFAPILYFILLTQVVKSKAEINGILRNFVYAATLIALIAYGMALFGQGLTYDFRLSGFYESANYLSLFLVPAILLNVHYIFRRTKSGKNQNLIDVSTFTVMAHALFFTQSYAAILAVFGSIVLYAFYFGIKYYGSVKRVITALIILVVTFAAIVATQIDSRKFKQFLDFENRSSTTVRLEIYEIAYQLINRYPLEGGGLGLFQARYQTEGPDILERAPMEWNIPHPHNLFFAFWLNAGLIGFVALILILVLSHFTFTYPLIALWGIVLHGFFDTPFWKNDLAMIWWLIIASILILQNEANPPKKRKIASKKRSSVRAKKRVAKSKRTA